MYNRKSLNYSVLFVKISIVWGKIYMDHFT